MVLVATVSPDGRYIAAGGGKDIVRVWDLEYVREQNISTLSGHTSQARGVVYSPSGNYLASGSWDNRVIIWSLSALTKVVELEHSSFVYSVDFSPDGQFLAAGTRSGLVYLWELNGFPRKEPQLVGLLDAHSDLVWSAAFSPDGKYLASSSWDRTIHRYLVRYEDVWDLSNIYLNWADRGKTGDQP